MYFTRERMQETHDHYEKNALVNGHRNDCQLVVGFWKTNNGVWVNWPTLNGRPKCTCGRDEIKANTYTGKEEY